MFYIWLLFFLIVDLEMRYASKLYQKFVKCNGLPKMFSWPSLKTAFKSEVNLEWKWDNFTNLNRNQCNLSSLSTD